MTVGVWGAIEAPVDGGVGNIQVLPNPERVRAKPSRCSEAQFGISHDHTGPSINPMPLILTTDDVVEATLESVRVAGRSNNSQQLLCVGREYPTMRK
jgi:hypothetical protein